MSLVKVKEIQIDNELPIVLIAGPCQIESQDHADMMSGAIAEVAQKVGMPFIYKSSFDKANRTSLGGQRGVGFVQGLKILQAIGQRGIPTLTDVHERSQCQEAADACEVLQIPAFLCRQTDLLLAAGETGAAINVKKGQFLAPWDMRNVVEKIESTGNTRILLTERGASFGYNSLVSDMRSLPIMAQTGYPVVFDATHSVQQPGGLGGSSGGQREFVPILARAAVAVGVAAVFMEVHQDPDNAPSDGPNMIHLDDLPQLLEQLMAIDKAIGKTGRQVVPYRAYSWLSGLLKVFRP